MIDDGRQGVKIKRAQDEGHRQFFDDFQKDEDSDGGDGGAQQRQVDAQEGHARVHRGEFGGVVQSIGDFIHSDFQRAADHDKKARAAGKHEHGESAGGSPQRQRAGGDGDGGGGKNKDALREDGAGHGVDNARVGTEKMPRFVEAFVHDKDDADAQQQRDQPQRQRQTAAESAAKGERPGGGGGGLRQVDEVGDGGDEAGDDRDEQRGDEGGAAPAAGGWGALAFVAFVAGGGELFLFLAVFFFPADDEVDGDHEGDGEAGAAAEVVAVEPEVVDGDADGANAEEFGDGDVVEGF